jgi:hypothetical protein
MCRHRRLDRLASARLSPPPFDPFRRLLTIPSNIINRRISFESRTIQQEQRRVMHRIAAAR